MSYFKSELDHYFIEAVESHEQEIRSIEATAASRGSLHSGATLVKYQTASYNALESFPEKIVGRLASYPTQHSPVSAADFALAKAKIENLRIAIEGTYSKYGSKIDKTLAGKRGLDAEKLDRLDHVGCSKVGALEEVVRSERSFWKWAFGDLKKRLWTGLILFLGTAAGALIRTFV